MRGEAETGYVMPPSDYGRAPVPVDAREPLHTAHCSLNEAISQAATASAGQRPLASDLP